METNDDLWYRAYTGKAENDKALNSLKGILYGFNMDQVVNDQELQELDRWAEKHYHLIEREPFREFITIIRDTLKEDVPKEEAIEDLYWLCQKYEQGNEFYDGLTADLQELQGICHGILSDGIIHDMEVKELEKWMDNNSHLASYYPYDELRTVLFKILKDGVVDETEKVLLKAYFTQFVQLSNKELTTKINNEVSSTNIHGLCAMDPAIEMDGKIFCFTGKLTRSNREEMAAKINEVGGIFNNNMTLKTNYLIVGDNGNPAWAFACYGRKVERALKMRKEGKNIIIVHEYDFFDYLDDL